MISNSFWIVGASRSGKTNLLVEKFCNWVEGTLCDSESFYTKNQREKNGDRIPKRLYLSPTEPGVLVLAANGDNRRVLADKIITATQGKYPVRSKTVLGFFQDEVILFWPLLIQSLNLKAQFPVRLRPETEQELATKLWHSHLDEEMLRLTGLNESRLVRRILDIFQLGAYSGTSGEDILGVLTKGLEEDGSNLEPELLGSLLLDWRNWCLQRGLLTYGIITELWYHHLLINPYYQEHLLKRYQTVLADDVDDYPGVARPLFEFLLDGGALGAFSFNPEGAVRLGLGADPRHMEGLALRCEVETLIGPPLSSLAHRLAAPMVELFTEPMMLLSLPESVQSIQTTSRAQLLRQTAEMIIQVVKEKQVQPEEVAVIGPGLDPIARYTLTEILAKQSIQVESLNDQRPLISSPIIRALLTILALVYPGLGRLVDRDGVAEMLVVLSGRVEEEDGDDLGPTFASLKSALGGRVRIDPVRAGLIADYCYLPHPDRPNLLPATAFERWDRLGYAGTQAYGEILQWLEQERLQQEQRLIPSPISLLYAAIEKFFLNGKTLPYDQLAIMRELLETAQHYWEIDTRLRQTPTPTSSLPPAHSQISTTISEFIQLLRRGTITANPYPMKAIGPTAKAVTLATIFQYRSSRRSHSWHFWLDASSPLWSKGGAATLFAAPLFLRERLGVPWTAEDEQLAEAQRLQRIVTDLLSRVSGRIYLCHSDLAVNGQEQLGPLLPLVNACIPVVEEPVNV
jgi:hypothetical protein